MLCEVFKVIGTIMLNELYSRNSRTVRYGTETISFYFQKFGH